MLSPNTNNKWLLECANLYPNRTAIETIKHKLTFTEFLHQSQSLANHLSEQGISSNTNVCVLAKHGFEFWIIINALWLIGAVPVPINLRNKEEDIFWQTNHVDAKFLITFFVAAKLSGNESIKIISLADYNFFNSSFANNSHKHFLNKTVTDNSLIMFTSGSTGKPKAVVHTFKSLFASALLIKERFDLSQNDTWLASLPLYHIGGFMILVRSLIVGAKVAFPQDLNFHQVVNSIKQFNPTHYSLVSTSLKRMLDENEKPNSNLKQVFLGGGFISEDLCIEALQNGFPIVKVYGSTETCSMVSALEVSKEIGKIYSAGKPLSPEIKIKCTTKNHFTEILVSSPTLFSCYYNDENATLDKIQNGFYHTGDFGFVDDDGYLHIETRREDLIISGGENISAIEVEDVLLSINKFSDCFVFGMKEETWGEILCAAVVSNNSTQEKIIDELKEKLPGYKIPKKFFFVNQIPRTELGKVKRDELLKLLNLDDSSTVQENL